MQRSSYTALADSVPVLLVCSSPVRPSTASFNTVFCTLTNVAQGVGDADKQVVAARWVEKLQTALHTRKRA